MLSIVTSIFLMAAAPAQKAMPMPIDAIRSDPIKGIQGEWVSRFCNQNHAWQVTGSSVQMLRRDPAGSPYDNRYAPGAKIMDLLRIFDTNDRMIRWKTRTYDPTGRASQYEDYAALTQYWSGEGKTQRFYFGFNDMIRADAKKAQCR